MTTKYATRLLETLKRNESRPTILKSLVEKWIVENQELIGVYSETDRWIIERLFFQGTMRNPEVYSPSGATNCKREQVISKAGFKRAKITDPRLIQIFDDGDWRHLRWQVLFWKMGLVRGVEDFVSLGKFDYGGSPDVIIELVDHPYVHNKYSMDTYYGVEIKGSNASQWNQIKRTHKPLRHHMVQAQVYMSIMNIGRWIFWYENKNTNEIVEIVVTYDPKIARHYRARRNYMDKFRMLGGFPKEECDTSDKADRKFRQCGQRRACPKLPVHAIVNGSLVKIGEPRIADPQFERFNTLPLVTLSGQKGERRVRSKTS